MIQCVGIVTSSGTLGGGGCHGAVGEGGAVGGEVEAGLRQTRHAPRPLSHRRPQLYQTYTAYNNSTPSILHYHMRSNAIVARTEERTIAGQAM